MLRLPNNESSCIVRQGYVPSLRAGEVLSGQDITLGYFHEHLTPERFLQGNLNVLRGHAKLPYLPAPPVGVHPRAQIAPSATIIAPVCIGAAAVVAEGAVVGPDVVLGDGASVAPGVELQRTVVLAGSAVHRSVTSAVVTPKAAYRLVLPDEESSAGTSGSGGHRTIEAVDPRDRPDRKTNERKTRPADRPTARAAAVARRPCQLTPSGASRPPDRPDRSRDGPHHE